MVEKILQGYGSVGNDFPINKAYPLFTDGIEQRTYDPDKAAFHYKKSGHSRLGPAAHLRRRLPGRRRRGAALPAAARPRPASPSRSSASRVTATGRKSGTCSPSRASYWGGRPTQDQMYSTAYSLDGRLERHALLERQTSTRCCSRRAPNSTRPSARRSMPTWAMIVRDEGGLILPMFNDFIDATQRQASAAGSRIRNRRDDGRLRRCPSCWLAA